MTDTSATVDTATPFTPEGRHAPGETGFDPTKPVQCRNGSAARVSSVAGDLHGERRHEDGSWRYACWSFPGGRSFYSPDFDLVNTPSTVPGGDRPSQADAAVAEAAAWQWRVGPRADWFTIPAADVDRCCPTGGELRPLYASPEAVLRATQGDRGDGWRAGVEAAAKHVETAFGPLWGANAEIAAAIRALPAPPSNPRDAKAAEAGDYGTDALINRFGEAVKQKLRAATAKYGWTANWQRADWQAECVADLVRHVSKGDPRDVAAYAAFAWHHGWSTTPVQPTDHGGALSGKMDGDHEPASADVEAGEGDAAFMDRVFADAELWDGRHPTRDRLIELARRTTASDASVAAGRDGVVARYRCDCGGVSSEHEYKGDVWCDDCGYLVLDRPPLAAPTDGAEGPVA